MYVYVSLLGTMSLHSARLNYLKEEMKEMKELLESAKSSGREKEVEETPLTPILGIFPIKTEEDLEATEEKLKEKEFFQSCVSFKIFNICTNTV